MLLPSPHHSTFAIQVSFLFFCCCFFFNKHQNLTECSGIIFTWWEFQDLVLVFLCWFCFPDFVHVDKDKTMTFCIIFSVIISYLYSQLWSHIRLEKVTFTLSKVTFTFSKIIQVDPLYWFAYFCSTDLQTKLSYLAHR